VKRGGGGSDFLVTRALEAGQGGGCLPSWRGVSTARGRTARASVAERGTNVTSQRGYRFIGVVLAGTLACAVVEQISTWTGGRRPAKRSSWLEAYQHLTDALLAASAGAEIHVAQGTYWPDRDPRIRVGRRPLASFRVAKDIVVLGGFAGLGAPNPEFRESASTPAY